MDHIVRVDRHDAETGSLGARDLETADGHVRALVDMLLQHRFVIHLVDVIAGQQHDEFRIVALDDVDVLEHRVGGAAIPVILGNALTRRQNVETLVALGAEKAPAALQMADQAMGLVLGRHGDAPDARVQRVGQREIDDARLAAKINRWLGASVGELHQPRAAPAGEHIGHGVSSERGVWRRASSVFPKIRTYSSSSESYSKKIVASGGNRTAALAGNEPNFSGRATISPRFPSPPPP